MTEETRHLTIFFYGLFMDAALLRDQGLAPQNERRACLMNHDIRIGRRAYVVVDPDTMLWGVLFDLPENQAMQLYGEPSVRDYRPEQVTAETLEGEKVEALCYNLPAGEAPRDNDDYLVKLIDACRSAGLPESHIDRLERMREQG